MARKRLTDMKSTVCRYFDNVDGLDKMEIFRLYNLIEEREIINGKSMVAFDQSSKGWCSDGGYALMERTVYSVHIEDDRFYVEERYIYEYDNGDRFISTREFNTARDVLRVIGKVFGKQEFIYIYDSLSDGGAHA